MIYSSLSAIVACVSCYNFALLTQGSVPALTVPMEEHVSSLFWEYQIASEFGLFFCVKRGMENPIPCVSVCVVGHWALVAQ